MPLPASEGEWKLNCVLGLLRNPPHPQRQPDPFGATAHNDAGNDNKQEDGELIYEYAITDGRDSG